MNDKPPTPINVQGSVAVGHPVDVASGVLSNTYVDATLAGRPPIKFVRSYSSALGDRNGLLGPGWTFAFDSVLRKTLEGYCLTKPDGRRIDFVDRQAVVDGGGVVRNLGAFCEVARDGSQMVVTEWSPDGTWIEKSWFPQGPLGRDMGLGRWQDRRGDVMAVERDRAGTIARLVQQRGGRVLELTTERGRLLALTAVARGLRRTVAQYGYGPDGRLATATDGAGFSAQYRYDQRGNLIEEIARDGSRWSFTFDAEGRCVRTTGQGGYDEKILSYDVAARTTRVTDSRGAVTTYVWNESGQVVRTESPLGRVSLSSYDELGRALSEGDASGATHAFRYDPAGNRCAIADPEGRLTKFEFDQGHRLIRYVDKAGHQWRRRHDAQGRLVEVVDPTEAVFRIQWNEHGDLVSVIGPGGLERRYFTSQAGETAAFSDSTAATIRYEHDAWGNLVATRDPLGNVTRRKYDALDQLVAVEWADGSITRNEYSASGALLRTIDRDGTILTYRASTCSGRWGAVELGRRVFRFTWENEPGALIGIQNPNGEQRLFDYDDDGYLVREVSYDQIETRYEYDQGGRLAARIVGDQKTLFEHDASGAVVKATYPDGSAIELEYDDLGRVKKATDGPTTVQFERDAFGRPIRENTGDFLVERRFDPMGRLIGRKTSLGFETTQHIDGNGRLQAITVGGQEVRFTYDALGRETRRAFADGAELHSVWDPMHRLAEQALLVETNTPSGLRSQRRIVGRSYRYDPADRLLSTDDDRWGQSRHEYDADGRLTRSQLGRVKVEESTYDAAGNLTSTSDQPPTGQARPVEPDVVKRRLGPGGRLDAEGGLGFDYDTAGRLTHIGMGVGMGGGGDKGADGPSWRYVWDGRGRLVEAELPDGERWHYGYDVFDRRIFKEKHGTQERTTYRWDGDRLVHEIRPDGSVTNWELAVGTLVPVAKQENDQTYFAVVDPIGAPRELVTADGSVTWSALLSPRGTIAATDTTAVDCPLRFPGQFWDRETGLSYNRFRYYSPARQQFLSRDPLWTLFDVNAYAYPNNPLLWIDPFGLLAEVLHNDPDTLGRPQGLTALVTPADIGTGTEANKSIRPPGFEHGDHPFHHQRAHLLGNQLGGDGNDPRNLVTMTGGSNHPDMANVEARIAAHVRAGNHAEVTVTPIYEGDSPIPSKVRITATDLATGETIADEEIVNGKHKNYSTCSH